MITLAKETREQPSPQEILGKLNSLQPIVEDHAHQKCSPQRTPFACSHRGIVSVLSRLLC
ncbi:hypothetical protein BDQ94DRAFT_164325 [Aspergillus welwitschiae]|uniref:Uncharacterized protein n=2 Tax=Aspergillus subgen. Circumdati TaxID=2720871 RepID=A0A3F3PI50_9EURO|nr:hypothetical protein BO88DRAFT_190200 [Aspergillus vadensis CBS 113365]XP_026619631.1 hypothetical protein BDQ94DRAFT_164325 [Aspergillus welwitschiae]PYH63959.1 hypothetical protein BO88DRAFT_190200 [Aspergillus vadensis CBS 113365]RDH26609.1 hypothetical protein BDQ94DRAFT_164325 [Aspergillus welwitschiae]